MSHTQKTHLNEELADILALVSLKLDHFTILWVLNHCPIAGKLLLRVMGRGEKGNQWWQHNKKDKHTPHYHQLILNGIHNPYTHTQRLSSTIPS